MKSVVSVFQVIKLSFSDRGNYLFNWQMSLREHLCDICLDVWLVIVNTSQCGQLWMCIVLTMMYRDWWHSISPLTPRDSGPHHAKFRFKRHKRQKYVHTLSPSHQAIRGQKGGSISKIICREISQRHNVLLNTYNTFSARELNSLFVTSLILSFTKLVETS